ncbi:MAG: helix-hairpin-helix domain-containing protein, partial [Acholeplasmataceae bacterium]
NYNNNQPFQTNDIIQEKNIVVIDIKPLKEKVEDLRNQELELDIPVCGLKKNKRHQLEGLVYQGHTKQLKPNDTLFKFLIKLSEEVHRFAITFHRKTRDKLAYASKLDEIEGIGPKRKARLIQQFGTFERIQEASLDALKQSGIPDAIIKKIKEHS